MSCLQIQAKLIAVIEIVVSTLLLIFFGILATIVTVKKEALMEAVNKHPHEHPHLRQILEASTLEKISIFLTPSVYFITELGLGVLLFHSAKKSNYKRLRQWFMITATLVTVGLIFFIAELLRTEDYVDILVLFTLNFFFTIYSLWVVYSLIIEIKAGGIHHPVAYNNGFYKL